MRRMFSEKQIERMVSEYEYEKDFTLVPSSENFLVTSAFTKILVKNKSMYICIVDQLKNNGTGSATTGFNNIDINDLPLEYQEKIIDINGKSLNKAPKGVDGNIIARFPLYVSASLLYVSLIHNTAGTLTIGISGVSSSLVAGAEVVIDGRIELCL